MPDCEAHRLGIEDQNVDIVPAEEWYKMADDIAAIFSDFLARKLPQTSAASGARLTKKAPRGGPRGADPNPASDLRSRLLVRIDQRVGRP